MSAPENGAVAAPVLPPRLVAFDLDGTLVDDGVVVSARVVAAVAQMRAAGVAGCIVTGRMYRAAVPFARSFGFTAPVVCYQGAAVVDPQRDEVLAHTALANDVVLDVIDGCESDGIHLQLYRNDEYYCEARNRFSERYAALAGVEPVVVPSLRERFRFSDSTKAVAIADAAIAAEVERRLRERLGARAYVTRSLPEFVEILDPRVDKGRALAFVAQRLGIDLARVVAIGDSWNDAPLLRVAGFAVAMGSAPPELRAIADAVVGNVHADGVAEALERYVLT